MFLLGCGCKNVSSVFKGFAVLCSYTAQSVTWVQSIQSVLRTFGLLIRTKSIHVQLRVVGRGVQEFINNLMELFSQVLPFHDLPGTFWFPRTPFSILQPIRLLQP